MTFQNFLEVFTELERQFLYLVKSSLQNQIKWDLNCILVPSITRDTFKYWVDEMLANGFIDQPRYDELMLLCPTETNPGSYAVNP